MQHTDLDITELTLREAARRIRSAELSPVDLLQALYDRIDKVDATHNAYIDVLYEEGLERACVAEQQLRDGHPLGPLHGVPIALKDNIASRGSRTRAGSRILSDYVPEQDATVTKRLRASGAVIMGHLNMHEFAFGVTGDNPHYGPTLNPWDEERIPGGSSSGSAAAVAARTALGAIGTDTGCSIRIPASFTGVTGLRPTIGRVSGRGVIPLAWTLDTVGPMCQTAYDCALVLGSIQGDDYEDPRSVDHARTDFTAGIGERLDGVRIGLVQGYSLEKLQPEVEHALLEAVRVFEQAGASIHEVEFKNLHLDEIHSALLTLHGVEAASYHGDWLREQPEHYGSDVRTSLDAGALHFGTQYVNAQRYRTLMQKWVSEVFESVDLLLTPTSPVVAPLRGASEVLVSDDVSFELVRGITRFTSIAPLSGIPGISVPCGFSDGGLPIGMQLMAREFDEATLLRAAHNFQMLTPWHTRQPAPA